MTQEQMHHCVCCAAAKIDLANSKDRLIDELRTQDRYRRALREVGEVFAGRVLRQILAKHGIDLESP